MDMERNLFDLVQNLEPEDELAEDKSEAIEMERIKLRVFQKKGVKKMRYRGLRRFAAAAAAVLVLAGGVVTVDAATDGKITKGIKEITLTIISPDGTSKEAEVDYIKKEDGTYQIHLGDDSSLEIDPGDSLEEGNYSIDIEEEGSADGKKKEVSVVIGNDKGKENTGKVEISKKTEVEDSDAEE